MIFNNSPNPYPNGKPTLGRWLGPAKDYSQQMTSKILMVNGEVVHWSEVCLLTQKKINSPVKGAKRKRFDEEIERICGPAPMIYDFEVEADTPVWEMYLDDSEKQMPEGPDVELKATPEIGDVFLDAEVMFP